MKTVLVPPAPGVCSAFGLLCADIERHYIQTFSRPWNGSVLEDLNSAFDRIDQEVVSSAERWGGKVATQPVIRRYVDLRYEGQSSEISIPVSKGKVTEMKIRSLGEAFENQHEQEYGHRLPGNKLQIGAIRLVAAIPTKRPVLKSIAGKARSLARNTQWEETRKAYWGKKYGFLQTPVLALEQVGKPQKGPVLVDCYDTTIVVPPGCSLAMGEWNNLIITIEKRGTERG
jgi:N-methylhydantoinase A